MCRRAIGMGFSLTVLFAAVLIAIGHAYAADPSGTGLTSLGRSPILDASFSRNGELLLTTFRDFRHAALWDVRSGKLLRVFVANSWPMNVATFSPDGKYILTGEGGGAPDMGIPPTAGIARLWDTATGKEIRSLRPPSTGLQDVQMSPNGAQILVVARDAPATMFDAATGKVQYMASEEWSFAQFGPGGKSILGTDLIGSAAVILDARTGRTNCSIHKASLFFATADFSPDGSRVLTANWHGPIVIWDARTGREVLQLKVQSADSEVSTAFFTAAGSRVVSGGEDGMLRLWETHTGRELHRFKSPGPITYAMPNQEGTIVHVRWYADSLTLGTDHDSLWDLKSGKENRLPAEERVLGFSRESGRFLVIAPDEKSPVLCDAFADLYNASTGRLIRRYK